MVQYIAWLPLSLGIIDILRDRHAIIFLAEQHFYS